LDFPKCMPKLMFNTNVAREGVGGGGEDRQSELEVGGEREGGREYLNLPNSTGRARDSLRIRLYG
jgi:hypothetical protein